MQDLNYRQYAIASFQNWCYIPSPELLATAKAQKIIADYLAVAQTIVLLCTPFEKGLSAAGFLNQHPTEAKTIASVLARLRDSCTWAIASCDPDAPSFPLSSEDVAFIQGCWEYEWDSKSIPLKTAFMRLYKKLKVTCPLTLRLGYALERMEESFAIAECLITKLKGDDPLAYVKKL